MPFKSDAQRRLMYAIVNDPKLAKKHGISLEVAREFIRAHEAAKKGKKK